MPKRNTKPSAKGARDGELKWRAGKESSQRNAVTLKLAGLLREISTWPIAEFADRWWAGDYKLLSLTWRQPGDLDVLVTCQSSAGSDVLSVTVSAKVRSKGRTRALNVSEQDALAAVGFRLCAGERAELASVLGGKKPAVPATEILTGIENAFGFGSQSVVLRFTLQQGTRLDEMHVLQSIRPYELVSLLQASGFETRKSAMASSEFAESEPDISVLGELPFTIGLTEFDECGYQTLRFSSPCAVPLAPTALNDLNRRLVFGAAVQSEDGSLGLRYSLCLSGGMSHAAIRDRIDDWVSSLQSALGHQSEASGPRASIRSQFGSVARALRTSPES